MKHRRTLVAVAAALALPAAHAFDIEVPDSDVKVRLDLTPKYSTAVRLKDPSAPLTGFNNAVDSGISNEDDGDHNFQKGQISNRFDLLAELDVTGKNFGGRISGTAWHDSVYLRHNSYSSTTAYGLAPVPIQISTANNLSTQAPNEFLQATRDQHGQGSEILDAFVYAKGDIGDMKGTVRLGKHTLQWGESLFFGQNGIANAQGPVDIAKVVSVPGWQFKEVLLPVEQVSGSLQVAEGVSLGAYYQFKWLPSKLPGVGSFFSNQDYVGTGIVGFGPLGNLSYDPSKDLKPKDSGQGGLQLRWSPTGGDYEFGFYAAQYHDKTPGAPVFDFVNNNVHIAYASDIRTYGASVTSSLGQLNWAVEGSIRDNAPLNSDPAMLLPAAFGGPIQTCGNSSADPCFAVGRTGHLQASGIYVLQPSALWQGGAVLGELAYNRTLSVTTDIFAPYAAAGFGGLDRNTTKGAFAFRMLFEPQYFQVAPGLDLSVPIGLGYNFGGRSSAVGNFAGGASQAGDYSIGLKGKYQNAWNFALTYSDFFGTAKTFTETVVAGKGSPRQLTFGQTLADRANLSFTVSRTF
jgi:hypothetical protein